MNLTDGLTEHLRDVAPPQPDLTAVVARGRRVRRARRATAGAVALLVVGVLAGTGLVLRDLGGHVVTEPPILAKGESFDLSHGLRAYGDPGRMLVMGGRSLPADRLEWLDTDAAATSYGVVYFRDGRPFLLQQSGESRPLWDRSVDDPKGWHPTAKYDPASAVTAFAVRQDDVVTIAVRDMTETAGMTLPVDCNASPGCDGLVVDGVDSGLVFVRTSGGTFTWDFAAVPDRGLEPFAGPRTRVADAKNRTLLYSGPRPTATLEGWSYVPGEVDAQLTDDGWNVLSWSRDLRSTKRGGAAIHLDLPDDARFFTVDTDGSVLAATTSDPARFYDCEVPSGSCEEIGALRMTGGDPMFIGNDM